MSLEVRVKVVIAEYLIEVAVMKAEVMDTFEFVVIMTVVAVVQGIAVVEIVAAVAVTEKPLGELELVVVFSLLRMK